MHGFCRFWGRLLIVAVLCLLFSGPLWARSIDLATAVSLAEQNHSLIKEMEQRLAASRQQFRAAAGGRLPQLELQAGYQRVQDQPYENFNGLRVPVNDKNIMHYQLDLVQPLFSGFALSARQKLADIGIDLARSDLTQARQDLRLRVTLSYLALLQQNEMVRVADESVTQLQGHLKDAAALFDQGLIPSNDLLKTKVSLARARQAQLRAHSSRKLTTSRLALLLGLPLEESLSAQPVELPAPSDEKLSSLVTKALQQRSEVASARSAIAAAGQQTRLARSRYYPQLNVIGSYQRDGNDLTATENPYRNSDNASIGLQLKWNLFASGADQARVSAADHLSLARSAALKQIEDMVKLDVEDALLKLKLARTNRQTAQQALQQARENHRLSTLQYREDLISTTDLLDARELLTRAETDLQTSRFGYLQALARLNHALGAFRQSPRSVSGS